MSIHKYNLKNGTGWRAIVQISPTRQVSKKFPRKIDAEAWEREQRASLAGHVSAHLELRVTVAELAERWLTSAAASRREASSNYRYDVCIRTQILPRLGSRRVLDLTPGKIDEWLKALREEDGLAVKTANLALMVLKKIITDAVRAQVLKYNPVAAVKPLPLPERDFAFWSQEESTQFLDHVRHVAPVEYPAFCLALYTGMRLGEIQALKWDCVDLATQQITVKRTYCIRTGMVKEWTKSKRVRRVPINGPLREVLIRQRTMVPGEMVVVGYDYEHASRRLKQRAQAAGVRPIRFHDLRHTFASLFVMAGGPIYKLQRLLGHSTIQMTERYAHLAPDHLANATDILNFELRRPAEVIAMHRG